MESASAFAVHSNGRDEEEQFHPRQRRRTSPRHPLTVGAFADSTPSTLVEASEETLLLEAPGEVVHTPSAAGGEVPLAESGSSWLQPRFQLPTEEEALLVLSLEITNRTPPLHNLRFNNHYVVPTLVVPF